MLSTQAQQEAAASERFESRRADRREHITTLLTPGGILRADSTDRVRKRLERLARFHEQRVPDYFRVSTERSPAREAGDRSVESLLRGAPRLQTGDGGETAVAPPEAETERRLERIIDTEDLIDIRYLESGVAASRAVGRVRIMSPAGRPTGYGTGFLVSPRLLLTNHHVLPDAEVAAASAIEFNFQDGLDGQPLQPNVFRLDPGAFWLTDDELDFALVAVLADPAQLAEFGFNRLIENEGKVIIGESVTIVQHPGGERKQIALRENRLVDVLEQYLHYETDTKPGSSGSPVFNDQWEVVALHHAAVRVPDRDELGGFANEGVRVSRLLRHFRDALATGREPGLRDAVIDPEAAPPRRAPVQLPGRDQPAYQPPVRISDALRVIDRQPQAAGTERPESGVVSIEVPLHITVRLGTPSAPGGVSITTAPAGVGAEEKVSIDPDYTNRKGYDAGFLGSGAHRVSLPTLGAALKPKATAALPYHHYSVVMNTDRRLAFFTAVNIDGHISHTIRRESDRWFFDPRIPREQQTGNEVYVNNDLDRGHLVRRLDPAWGSSAKVAKVANDDTFHYTNSAPQHHDFNANRTTWAGLEDYILKNAKTHDLKVSVFTGPIFDPTDDQYRGVQLPRQFWKVVVMVTEEGELSATGYLLSQDELLDGLTEAMLEGFSYGAYRTYQVPVKQVETLTGLSFGNLSQADPGAELESFGPREIVALEDVVL